jgi:hypothetical protein
MKKTDGDGKIRLGRALALILFTSSPSYLLIDLVVG